MQISFIFFLYFSAFSKCSTPTMREKNKIHVLTVMYLKDWVSGTIWETEARPMHKQSAWLPPVKLKICQKRIPKKISPSLLIDLQLLGEKSPWVSHVSACLYSWQSSLVCLFSEQPWTIHCLPPEWRTDMLTAYYKILGFTKFCIPLLWHMCSNTWPFCTTLRITAEIWLLILLWVINYPLSLTQASYIFWQSNLLACK